MKINGPILRDPGGGKNQSGLRDLNARLVLSFVRRHGGMSSAEIARSAGLSAQTVSNILRTLSAEALVKKGKSVKGKVGKPYTPIELNPDGVFSVGVNIGRRSAEIVLVDFVGNPIAADQTAYAYPEIGAIFDFIRNGIKKIYKDNESARPLTVGIGVSRPNEMWNWLEIVNAPEAAMQAWKELDLGAEIEALTGLEAIVQNDATSACVAEHLLGRGAEFTDFAYVFVGAFLGGGVVLDDKVFWGRTGNAGALGILPVPDGSGNETELLEVASLHVLQAQLARSGISAASLRSNPDDWSQFEPHVTDWIDKTGHHLARAAAAIASIIEVEAILIDGAMPTAVRERLTKTTANEFEQYKLAGIERPQIVAGTVGRNARSIGAALLPIHSRYFLA